MRLRLARTELRSVARNLHDVVVFSRFIAESRPDQQNDPAVLDRALLESYIGRVGRRTVEKKGPHYGQPVSSGSRIRLLSVMSTMLEYVAPLRLAACAATGHSRPRDRCPHT